MKNRQIFSLLFIIVISLCGYLVWVLQNNIDKDPFYTDLGGDAMRIPLLKPYELVKIDRKQVGWWSLGWSINLHIPPSEKEIYYYLAIHDIKKFAVENGIIIVYTNYQQDVDEDVGQKVLNWFVLIPNQEVEIGFENENEFLDYIHLLGIKTPNWVSPDEAYNQFFETRCLNWIPGCN